MYKALLADGLTREDALTWSYQDIMLVTVYIVHMQDWLGPDSGVLH